jgi:hypothetical protein
MASGGRTFRERQHWLHEGGIRAPMIVSWEGELEGDLYDMDAGPTETANLAEEYTEKVVEMAAMRYAWAEANELLPMPQRPPWFFKAKENQPLH